MGLIHVSNTIAQPRALEAGMTVNLSVAARNYRKTDAGLTFDMDTERARAATKRSGARPACSCRAGRKRRSAQRRPARAPAEGTEGRQVLTELEVDLARAWSYARVSATSIRST